MAPVPPPPGATVVVVHTYEARRVVVSDGLGVPKSLQYRVCLDDLILQGPLAQRETHTHKVGSCLGIQGFQMTYLCPGKHSSSKGMETNNLNYRSINGDSIKFVTKTWEKKNSHSWSRNLALDNTEISAISDNPPLFLLQLGFWFFFCFSASPPQETGTYSRT